MRNVTLLAATVVAMVLGGPVAAGAQEATGTVTVVHAVPGTPVDVYVDGAVALEDFRPKTVTDPIELPAGEHEIEIRPAGEEPDSDPVIAGSASLPADANASVVAHLTEDGEPALAVFVNDVSRIDAGDARVTVRHTAAAPAVDITAGGDALISDLANGDEQTAEVPAGSYDVAVQPAGTSDAVIGPVDLALDEGTAYLVYAFGSVDDGNLDLLVQTIDGLHGAPGGVPAGTGGQAASGGTPLLLLFTMGLAAVAAVLAARRLATARG